MDLITPFLKVFFHLIYHQFTWSYDFIAWFVSGGRWNAWVLSAGRFIQGPNVLELGFGPGHLLLQLVQKRLNVVGMDASRQMVNSTKRKLAMQNCSAGLVCGQGEFLPFCKGFFNCVVATFPTSYILQPDTLKNIHRILAPDGLLVILLSSWIIDKSLYGRSLAWLFHVTGQSAPQQFEMEKLLQQFQNAGFQAHPEFLTLEGSRLLFVIAGKSNQ